MAAYRCIVVAPPHTPVPGQHSYTSTPLLPNTLQPSKHLKHRGTGFLQDWPERLAGWRVGAGQWPFYQPNYLYPQLTNRQSDDQYFHLESKPVVTHSKPVFTLSKQLSFHPSPTSFHPFSNQFYVS